MTPQKLKHANKNSSRDGGFGSRSRLRFSLTHALKSLLWLIVLIVIACYVRDDFIRPTLGDVFVVVWLHYLLASIVNVSSKITAAAAVLIAYLIEMGQYLQINQWLNIAPSSVLHIILGATFDGMDLLAYLIGGMLCLLIDIEQS
ncbi:DUF2809 domain-containing protein [Agarivorans sp. QJM3NY_29]|uniref:ribosomal maturation YjgA family protein n=1 Tax=unclassified Agarivorans TaxID=2636026 RepID=UPI003D7D14DB